MASVNNGELKFVVRCIPKVDTEDFAAVAGDILDCLTDYFVSVGKRYKCDTEIVFKVIGGNKLV